MAFLLDRAIFPWDLAILLVVSASFCVLLASVVRLRSKRRTHWTIRTGVSLTGFASFVVLITVLYGSFVEPLLLTVTTAEVRLPVGEPLTIAVVGDLHLGPYQGATFTKRIVDEINDLRPDIVLLLGDYFFDSRTPTSAIFPLSELVPSLGTYAVFGNYETGQVRDASGNVEKLTGRLEALTKLFPAMGIISLRNENQVIRLRGSSLAIAGVGDTNSGDADLATALNNIPDGTPVILISHNPDIILDAASKRASLIVSAHTHGGQIRLPFYGPLSQIPTKLGNAFDQGIFKISNRTTLAITRGVGETMSRARLFAPPEILVLRTMP